MVKSQNGRLVNVLGRVRKIMLSFKNQSRSFISSFYKLFGKFITYEMKSNSNGSEFRFKYAFYPIVKETIRIFE